MAINSSCPYLRCSSPNKSATSKWHRFELFGLFWLSWSSIPPKSGYGHVDSSYLDLGILFLVGTTTRVKILPHKCFLLCSIAKMPESVANSFALFTKCCWRLLFFHLWALLLLPQRSYNTDTGSSRAPLRLPMQANMECPPWNVLW